MLVAEYLKSIINNFKEEKQFKNIKNKYLFFLLKAVGCGFAWSYPKPSVCKNNKTLKYLIWFYRPILMKAIYIKSLFKKLVHFFSF